MIGCLFNSLLIDHTEGLLFAWATGLLFAGLPSLQNRRASTDDPVRHRDHQGTKRASSHAAWNPWRGRMTSSCWIRRARTARRTSRATAGESARPARLAGLRSAEKSGARSWRRAIGCCRSMPTNGSLPNCARRSSAAMRERRHSYAAFRMPRLSSYCGRFMRHSGWWPDHVTRLFRRGSRAFFDDLVHERLIVDGTTRHAAGIADARSDRRSRRCAA